MQAIQTKYAGCFFRSRLEARWAVFLDHVGIQWQYEYQGFACPYRLTLEDGTFPYLPDFWLPELGMYAEVKGSLTANETKKVLNSAAHFSENGHDMLILGHIPHESNARLPWRLSWYKGDLIGYPWIDLYGQIPTEKQMNIGDEYIFGSDSSYIAENAGPDLLNMASPQFFSKRAGEHWNTVLDNFLTVKDAYQAAREARF